MSFMQCPKCKRRVRQRKDGKPYGHGCTHARSFVRIGFVGTTGPHWNMTVALPPYVLRRLTPSKRTLLRRAVVAIVNAVRGAS